MKNIWNKIVNFFGFEVEEITEYPEENNNEKKFSNQKKQKSNVVSLHGPHYKIIVLKIKNFDAVQEISDHLARNTAVIINLEDLDRELAGRILDFLSGAVYATDGKIQKVSSSIFLAAPGNFQLLNSDHSKSGLGAVIDKDKRAENIFRR